MLSRLHDPTRPEPILKVDGDGDGDPTDYLRSLVGTKTPARSAPSAGIDLRPVECAGLVSGPFGHGFLHGSPVLLGPPREAVGG